MSLTTTHFGPIEAVSEEEGGTISLLLTISPPFSEEIDHSLPKKNTERERCQCGIFENPGRKF